MKLYTCTGAPSPRRVTLYIAAKGIDIEQIEVSLKDGEHMSKAFLAKSPDGTVPVLELDDGRYLWDSMAIRRYLEDRFPAPALMGATAESRAEVLQWTNWVVSHGLQAVAEAFRNRFPGFKNHALTGPHPVEQIDALAQRGLDRYPHFIANLEQRLGDSTYVAGETMSVADIDALVTIEFAERAIKLGPQAEHASITAWRARLNEYLGQG